MTSNPCQKTSNISRSICNKIISIKSDSSDSNPHRYQKWPRVHEQLLSIDQDNLFRYKFLVHREDNRSLHQSLPFDRLGCFEDMPTPNSIEVLSRIQEMFADRKCSENVGSIELAHIDCFLAIVCSTKPLLLHQRNLRFRHITEQVITSI
jgi:hypothetical protein